MYINETIKGFSGGDIRLATNTAQNYVNVFFKRDDGRTWLQVCFSGAEMQKLRDLLIKIYPLSVASTAASRSSTSSKGLLSYAKGGDQKYKGNGKHKWEEVTGCTTRLRVPGGWLYNDDNTNSVFVPLPDVIGHAI